MWKDARSAPCHPPHCPRSSPPPVGPGDSSTVEESPLGVVFPSRIALPSLPILPGKRNGVGVPARYVVGTNPDESVSASSTGLTASFSPPFLLLHAPRCMGDPFLEKKRDPDLTPAYLVSILLFASRPTENLAWRSLSRTVGPEDRDNLPTYSPHGRPRPSRVRVTYSAQPGLFRRDNLSPSELNACGTKPPPVKCGNVGVVHFFFLKSSS